MSHYNNNGKKIVLVKLNFRPIYSLKDRYYNLKQEERSVVRHAFGKQSGEMGYSVDDVLEMYKKKPNADDVEAQYFIRQFAKAIRTWKIRKGKLERQLKERERFRQALMRHAKEDGGKVLFDLRLEHGGISCDIDAVLIMKNGIVPLMLRTPSGDSGVDDNGNFCWFDAETVSLEKVNIRHEQSVQKVLLTGILEDALDSRFGVYPAMIIGGGAPYNYKNRRDISFGSLEAMEKSISLDDMAVFDQPVIELIEKAIKSARVKTPRQKIPFRSELIKAYWEVYMKML